MRADRSLRHRHPGHGLLSPTREEQSPTTDVLGREAEHQGRFDGLVEYLGSPP